MLNGPDAYKCYFDEVVWALFMSLTGSLTHSQTTERLALSNISQFFVDVLYGFAT